MFRMDGRSIYTTLEHTLIIIEPAHGRDHQVAPHLNAQCTRLLIPGDGRAIATPMLSDCVVVLSHVTGMYLRPAQLAEDENGVQTPWSVHSFGRTIAHPRKKNRARLRVAILDHAAQKRPVC